MSVIQVLLDPDKVHLLEDVLAQGADINEKDEDGVTAMHIAIKENMDQEVFDILLKNGATLDSVNNEEKTPIRYVDPECFDPLLKLLRAEKKFPLKDSLGNTVMHWLLGEDGELIFNFVNQFACKQLYEGEIDYCVEVQQFWDALLAERQDLNIDMNTQNKKGKTILHIAAASHLSSNHLRIMLAEFPDVNPFVLDKDGNTFLHIHFSEYKIKGCETFDEELLQGQMAACSKQVLQGLLCCKNAKGETPVYSYFKQLYNSIDVTRLSLFLQAGADFSLTNNCKETLLHKVFRTHYKFLNFKSTSNNKEERDIESKIKFLVYLGVNVNGQDMFGNSPIYYARSREAVLCLINNGADLNIQNKSKQTPLLWFFCHKAFSNVKIIETLLEKGSDVNAQDMHGNTVLHYEACLGVRDDLKPFLRKYKVKHLKDCHGNLPCHVAVGRGNQEFIDIFCNCPSEYRPHVKHSYKLLTLEQITEQTTETLASLKQYFDGQCGNDLSDLIESPVTGCVQWSTEESEIKAAMTEIVQRLCNTLSKLKPILSGKLKQSGSVGDGAKVGLPDEFDFVYVLDNLGDMLTVEETVSNDPSFIHFRQKAGEHNSELDQLIRFDGILNAGYTWKAIFFNLLEIIKDQSIFNHTNVWPDYEQYLEYESFPWEYAYAKPSLQIDVVWVGQKYKVLPISIDLVFAINTKGFWPKNAKTEQLLANIKSEGAIALVQTDDVDGGINFRLSALLAEKSVMNGLPKIAKDTYNIAKIMLKYELCPQIQTDTDHLASNFITSYMLKNSLLHVLDEHRDYTITDKGVVYTAEDLKILVMRLFQKLLQYSKQENLPNFIFRWQNIFTFKLLIEKEEKQIHRECCHRQLFLKLILVMLGDEQSFGDVDRAILMEHDIRSNLSLDPNNVTDAVPESMAMYRIWFRSPGPISHKLFSNLHMC